MSRELVIHTGQAGMRMFDKAVRIDVLSSFANWLGDNGDITRDEANRLNDMLHSPDEENFEIAKIILDTYRNTEENG